MQTRAALQPREDKAWARKLEEDVRSCRNCRHVYSLLGDAAAKGFSGGANIDKRNKSGLGPSEHTVIYTSLFVVSVRCV